MMARVHGQRVGQRLRRLLLAVHGDLAARLDDLKETLITMSDQQAHLDENVAAIVADVQTLVNANAAVNAALEALRAANPGVDFASLDAARAGADAAAAAIVASPVPVEEPAPVDPAPADTDAPADPAPVDSTPPIEPPTDAVPQEQPADVPADTATIPPEETPAP